ncbi:purine permease 11 isoform X1 [Populus alba x Populus x berolinensis]|uniref:Probable purine permease n=1 Tax=Populus alba x Populus x berolinensis TaxID=444605 RepID=A0AAD6LRR8_9ROSI|nr:purine permease 11 isoform X1 [Populus alba x Populus x berolinensis]
MEVTDNEEPILNRGENTVALQSLLFKLQRWQWWLLVAINVFFLVAGQSAAVLLGRFYYDQGGNSKWIATVIQTAGFPILFIPLFLLPSDKEPLASYTSSPSVRTLASIYLVLGVIIAGDNYLYSLGLSYLSASTYSLICASQLAFNAVFSYFINSQKFTALILNSVIILSFSSALIAVNDDSGGPSGVSKWKYFLGFLVTLGASAVYSLLLSLMQLSFQKVIKKETFSVVLEMQIFTSLVATCVSVAGLFASGEWKTLHGEMQSFGKGSISYVLTLVWTAVTWQVCSVGVVGLIFVVSSLFSNVISTVALAVSPIAAVIVFHDKMNGVKIIAMLLAVWGFASYTYQNYLDDSKLRKAQMQLIPHAMGTLIFVVVLYLVNQTIFSSFSSSAALIISFASMIHVKKFMKQQEAVMDFELGSFCSLGH